MNSSTPPPTVDLDALTDLPWRQKRLSLPFRVSDWTIWNKKLQTHVCGYSFGWIVDNQHGFTESSIIRLLGHDKTQKPRLLRSLPVETVPPTLVKTRNRYLYTSKHYQRFYADLSIGSESYQKYFSSKSRSTLRRKVRKLGEACGGKVDWKEYRTPEELEHFYSLARKISEHTYQEKLLDAGLPANRHFFDKMQADAKADAVRAFILFDEHGRGLAYLYCPVIDGTVIYQYLGYISRHELNKFSPGTVLLWLVMHRLQDEGCYQWFDFTEGSDTQATGQKSRFGTGSIQCADIWVFPRAPRYALLINLHRMCETLSETAGSLLDRWGLKQRIKHWMRTRTG